MDRLKELLAGECDYRLPDAVMDRFLGAMSEVCIGSGETLVRGGAMDGDVYLLKEGIMCDCYFDGTKEKVHAFSLPGTMMISLHSYYMGRPAFFHVMACCDSVVMRLDRRDFDRLVDESHAFAKWVSRMLFCQLYFYEMKLSVIHGNARERFLSLMKNRPEIMEKVSLKLIASYLGITQSYLSRLKRELF